MNLFCIANINLLDSSVAARPSEKDHLAFVLLREAVLVIQLIIIQPGAIILVDHLTVILSGDGIREIHPTSRCICT